MVWLLLGCGGSDVAPDPDSNPTDDVAACVPAPVPDLSTTTWEQTAPIPAVGFHTLASAGGAPVWIGSHMNGVWRAELDLAWRDTRPLISHTQSELVLHPSDPAVVWRSAGGALDRTRDGGATWERVALDVGDPTRIPTVAGLAMTPWDGARIRVVETDGASWTSEDDGVTFRRRGTAGVRAPPEHANPYLTFGWRLLPEVEAGGRIVLGDGFGATVSDDGMSTWSRVVDEPSGASPLLRDPADPSHLVLGHAGGFLESVDQGDTWTARTLPDDVMAGEWSRDTLVFVGEHTLFLSRDGGATFAEGPHGVRMPTAALALDDGRVLVANNEGVSVTADDGATWADVSAGLQERGLSVLLADPDCPGELWAGSRCGGGVFRSFDHGASWSPVEQYFHYVMDLVDGPDGRMWGVTDDRLLRSDDDGETWETSVRLAHFHGFAAHPERHDELLLGSVGSGLWADDRMRVRRSDDAGVTWADSSDGLPVSTASAHNLARWPGDPDVVLLATYKGEDVSHSIGSGVGLWRSEDDAGTWSLALDVPDVAMLAAGDDAVVAATGDGLWRGEDRGRSWVRVDGPSGLVLAVRLRGRVGAALTQSGEVWTSVDDGRSWSETSAGLPVNTTTFLAAVDISADLSAAYVTVFEHGVYRIRLAAPQ